MDSRHVNETTPRARSYQGSSFPSYWKNLPVSSIVFFAHNLKQSPPPCSPARKLAPSLKAHPRGLSCYSSNWNVLAKDSEIRNSHAVSRNMVLKSIAI